MASATKSLRNQKDYHLHINTNLILIVCISLTGIVGVIGIHPAMPDIAKALNIPNEQVGLIVTSFLIPSTIGSLMFGALADRFGRKQILVPSLLLFGVGGILCALTNNFRSLLEWRFLAGIGAASLEPLELTLLSDLYSGPMLTSAMGFNAAMIGIAATIYPVIGGALGGLNWRYPFLLSLIAFPMALLVVTKLKLPKLPSKQNNAQNIPLNVYLKNIWINVKNPQVFGLLFALFCMFIIELGTFYTYVPILAGTTLKASVAEIGIILCCESIAFSLAASQLGLLARHFSEKSLIIVGFLVFVVSLLIVPTIHNSWFLILPCVLFGASQALAFPTLQAMLAGVAPEGYRAGFMALNVTIQSLGRALGPLFAGFAYSVWGMGGVFYASAALSIIAIVVFAVMTTSKKSKRLSNNPAH